MPLFKPKTKENEYEQAARLLTAGKAADSIPILRSILTKNPQNGDAMVTLAVALMEVQAEPAFDSSQTQEALALLEQASRIAPKSAIPHFNRGVCLRKTGKLEEALASFESALKLEEKSPLVLLHMAEVNYELGRWEKALDLARKALARDPGLESALVWVPDAMRKAGRLEEKGTQLRQPGSGPPPDA
ncbi:MAG: tetratricopeptide repeat protein [Candidatus Thorarchaeota archaeon]|nr:tetratricopeptide repeat protein [Candidatus Thorarchaeota archaeon]